MVILSFRRSWRYCQTLMLSCPAPLHLLEIEARQYHPLMPWFFSEAARVVF
jgi:hypothetical protein